MSGTSPFVVVLESGLNVRAQLNITQTPGADTAVVVLTAKSAPPPTLQNKLAHATHTHAHEMTSACYSSISRIKSQQNNCPLYLGTRRTTSRPYCCSTALIFPQFSWTFLRSFCLFCWDFFWMPFDVFCLGGVVGCLKKLLQSFSGIRLLSQV